jgi:CRISPR-associated endoribonuclease Cas6
MRIRINLALRDKTISVRYNSLLQGFIYTALGYPNFNAPIHDHANRLENRPFKLFVFSEINGKSKYLNKEELLYFEEDGYFDFSSYNQDLVIKIIDYMNLNNNILLGKQVVKILGYDILNDYVSPNRNHFTFRTCSPIVCYQTENKRVKYFDPQNKEFSQSIMSNLEKKYFICYNDKMPDMKIIKIDSIKKKVVYFRKVFYIAYHCSLTIETESLKLVSLILSTGLGSKNSMGFGMVQL